MGSLFTPKHGPALWGFIAGGLIAGLLLVAALAATPGRMRKPLIAAVTFLGGLFYIAEFLLPTGADNANFLTAYRTPAAQINQVLLALAVGVGIWSLITVHGRNIARQKSGWGYSVVLLVSMVAIAVAGILKEYRPNSYNKAAFSLLFDGGLKSLEATMFSIIAFYIVSAAYRAFRIRSVEATILLVSACLVMLGQVALGQAVTGGIPNTGFLSNFRFEVISNWILTRVNSPALLAVELGLGVGALSTSLRLWLNLERGSYFDKEV